ncbi:hypothetical protein D3C80_1750570 [compost metagenome]
MDKPLFQQKIQRTVNGRRFCLRLADTQQVQQIIGADRTGLLRHQTQYFQPLRGQANIALLAKFFSL